MVTLFIVKLSNSVLFLLNIAQLLNTVVVSLRFELHRHVLIMTYSSLPGAPSCWLTSSMLCSLSCDSWSFPILRPNRLQSIIISHFIVNLQRVERDRSSLSMVESVVADMGQSLEFRHIDQDDTTEFENVPSISNELQEDTEAV